MENIGKYLDFCEKQLGVQKGDQFQTVDLYEKQNMGNVSKPDQLLITGRPWFNMMCGFRKYPHPFYGR